MLATSLNSSPMSRSIDRVGVVVVGFSEPIPNPKSLGG